MTHLSKLGWMLPFPLLLCVACSKPAIRTEVVKIPTPVYVALPDDLLRTCVVSLPVPLTNGLLVEYAIGLQACLAASNDKMERIKKLQP